VNHVPVFASPSAHGIKCIFGSMGQERAKFKFVGVSADFVRLNVQDRVNLTIHYMWKNPVSALYE